VIHLATGLAIHQGRVLLVASHYPNRAEPLWNLPGGRQQAGELLADTAVREFLEETGIEVRVDRLAYVSESYDGDVHFLNVTFKVVPRTSFDGAALPWARHDKQAKDHVVAVEWVSLEKIAKQIVVDVVREPLLAYLRNAQQYAGFHEAGITIEWPGDSE
jgi:8-oxo-dGTP pyrophosphatase MutT (NUDIX family)